MKNTSKIKKIGSILLVGTILTASVSAMITHKLSTDNSKITLDKELVMKAYDEDTLNKLMFEPQEVVDTSVNIKYSMLGC